MKKIGKNFEEIDRFAAQEQHQATIKLLSWSPIYSKLMATIPSGKAGEHLMKLIRSDGPVSGAEFKGDEDVTPGAISQRFVTLNNYLKSFSENLKILRIKHVIIEVPRRPITEARFGYYLACFDMRNTRYLSGKEILGVLATTDFVYFRIPEEVLGVNDTTAAQWFRPDGPFYSDFQKDKYYLRKEVEDLKKALESGSNSTCLLVGDGATGKTTIIKTLIYNLYEKNKLTGIYYFDISPRRYFDELQLFKEIQSVDGTFIIENIHLRQQTIQLIYEKFKNDPGRHFLFTARQPHDEYLHLILKDSPDIHTVSIEPFVDADKLIDVFCNDPETPPSVRDRRDDIIEVSKNDFWRLAFALKQCAKTHGQGDPQSWIKDQVLDHLQNLESCRDEYDAQYPGILVAISPLYTNETLTEESFLKKLGFAKDALNGLIERAEITRQTDSDNNTYYGLPHSSRAAAYWEHGKRYIENPKLRDYKEFIYDYAVSNTSNGLDAIGWTELDVQQSLYNRLVTNGQIAKVIVQEESIEAINYCLSYLTNTTKEWGWLQDERLLEIIARKISNSPDLYYSGRTLATICEVDPKVARKLWKFLPHKELAVRLFQVANYKIMSCWLYAVKSVGDNEDLQFLELFNLQELFYSLKELEPLENLFFFHLVINNISRKKGRQFCKLLVCQDVADKLGCIEPINRGPQLIFGLLVINWPAAYRLCSLLPLRKLAQRLKKYYGCADEWIFSIFVSNPNIGTELNQLINENAELEFMKLTENSPRVQHYISQISEVDPKVGAHLARRIHKEWFFKSR